jgi:ABC-type transporter Mla subunit MlaD
VSETRRNIAVGTFVLVGIVLLGVLTIWFGEEPDWLKNMTGGGTYPLHITFEQLSDVETGTEVRMAVGPVGRVANVRYRDPMQPGKGIVVVAEIREDIRVPGNAVAIVQPGSMFARSYILLSYPELAEAPVPTDGKVYIKGEVAGILDNIIPKTMLTALEKATTAIGNLADGLTPVSHDLHELFQRRPVEWVDHPQAGMAGLSANLYTVAERLDLVLKNINVVVGDPQTQSRLRDSIENLHQASEDGRAALAQFHEFAKELRGLGDDMRAALIKIETTVDHADENGLKLARKLMEVTDQLSDVLTKLDQAGTSLAQGNGTAALLLNDQRLYEEMVLTFQRLSAAAQDLQSMAQDIQKRGLKTRL